jgi:hypothetical protein
MDDNWLDSSGNGYNGVAYKFVGFTSSNTIVDSDAGTFSEAYATLAGSSANDFSSGISMGGWFNFASLNGGTQNTLMGNWNGIAGNGFLLQINNGNLYDSFQSYPAASNSISSLSPNTWYDIIATYNSLTGTTNIYVDGNVFATDTGANGIDVKNGENFVLGQQADLNGYSFQGDMDEIAIWNRELTPMEVNALYNNGYGCQVQSC